MSEILVLIDHVEGAVRKPTYELLTIAKRLGEPSAVFIGPADKASDAAEAMRVTAADLQGLGVVDRVVPEPLGGAHRSPAEAIANLKAAVVEELDGLAKLDRSKLIDQRRAKFLAIG